MTNTVKMVKKWNVLELEFSGHSDKNPFEEYEINAEFTNENEQKKIQGFYDGEGIYRVRFMPSFEGKYTYRVYGSFSDIEHTGEFMVDSPQSSGQVFTEGTHFSYSDGRPYYSIGTTCYAWTCQTDELREQTIETLKNGAFNKIRFCIFPKHYDYNFRDPDMFPYEGEPVSNSEINKYNFEKYKADNPDNKWDFTRFNINYFRRLDKSVNDLMEIDIQADIILFHPYDRWGFSKMPSHANDLYLKYVVARYGAFRNVWWSLANEYDLCQYKTIEDWEHFAQIIGEYDPYNHLISIHNCVTLYDYTKQWITHCSIQRQAGKLELDFIPEWIKFYNKPVVIDEMCYEGNIEQYWGSIKGEEMLRRMWKTYILGGYPGHSECYFNDDIWWSHGGVLHGESHKRFGFLHKIMTECGRLNNTGYLVGENSENSENSENVENVENAVILRYFGEHAPSFITLKFGEERNRVEIIDTWNMTIDDRGIFTGNVQIDLPGREYMALRMTRL